MWLHSERDQRLRRCAVPSTIPKFLKLFATSFNRENCLCNYIDMPTDRNTDLWPVCAQQVWNRLNTERTYGLVGMTSGTNTNGRGSGKHGEGATAGSPSPGITSGFLP